MCLLSDFWFPNPLKPSKKNKVWVTFYPTLNKVAYTNHHEISQGSIPFQRQAVEVQVSLLKSSPVTAVKQALEITIELT